MEKRKKEPERMKLTNLNSFLITIKNIGDIPRAVEKLLEVVGDSPILAFYAEMGAGKTTIISEICRQSGVKDRVNSPTFAIVNEYNTNAGQKIYHFDFYRINKIEEAFDFGCEEYFHSGERCLIEWPEKIEEILPENSCKIEIEVMPDGTREVKILNNY